MKWALALLLIAQASNADIVRQDVRRIYKQGDTPLFGEVTLSAGNNVTLTQSGQNIAISATSGSSTCTLATKTSSYAVTTSDCGILADASSGNITITLAASSTAGNGFRTPVKKIDSTANFVRVLRSGSDTIDGDTDFIFTVQDQAADFIADGATKYRVF